MADKEHIKIAVMGCGWIAKSFAFFSKFVKNAKIVAAMDLNLSNACKIAGKKCAYTDAEKMYEKEDFDAVYVATPHFLHNPMIKQAFEHGKHVLCEKPVGISVEDARQIKVLDEKYPKLKLGFNYDRRYNYYCYNMASGVKAGQIGEPYFGSVNVYYSRNLNYFDKGPWRSMKEKSGGGTVLIHGSHMIDILCWALGEPKSITGTIKTKKFDIEVEDVGLGIVEFENGTIAQITSSMAITPRMRKLTDLEEIQIFGEKGRVHFSGQSPFTKLKWHGVKKYKIPRISRGFHTLQRSLKAFANWILNDQQYFNTIDESSKALRVVMGLYKASETSRKELIEKL